jgi:CubicO group peptidase (beta-lactamase class C family)
MTEIRGRLPDKGWLSSMVGGLVLAGLSLCAGHAMAGSVVERRIDAIMQEAARNEDFNGNVLVARNGQVVYDRSFGVADATKSRKLDSSYRFNIGSITKEFSGVAVLQLQEQGRLSLEDPVSKYIPEFSPWADQVAVKYLLDYTSGIPNVDWKKIRDDRDIYEGLRGIKALDFVPGTDYDYNNNNIFVRQLIVERLTGQTYKAYVADRIFRRCDMQGAAVTPVVMEEDIASGFKPGFVADKPELPITGGSYLSTGDMLKWSNCLGSGRLLTPESLAALVERYDLPDSQSSLGQVEYKDGRIVRHVHDGRSGSYESLLISGADFTIVLFGNRHRGKLFEIADAIESSLQPEVAAP